MSTPVDVQMASTCSDVWQACLHFEPTLHLAYGSMTQDQDTSMCMIVIVEDGSRAMMMAAHARYAPSWLHMQGMRLRLHCGYAWLQSHLLFNSSYRRSVEHPVCIGNCQLISDL